MLPWLAPLLQGTLPLTAAPAAMLHAPELATETVLRESCGWLQKPSAARRPRVFHIIHASRCRRRF